MMEKVLPMNKSIDITIKNENYSCMLSMSFTSNQQIQIGIFKGLANKEKLLFTESVCIDKSDVITSPDKRKVFVTYKFGLKIIQSTLEKYLIYRTQQESMVERLKNLEIIEQIKFN